MNKTERQAVHSDVNQKALDLANEAVRRDLLEDTANSFFERTLADITGQSLSVLRYSWNPFEMDMMSEEGLGVRLIASDPLVLELMRKVDLYDKAMQIAMDAFVDAMTVSQASTGFMQMLLEDLVVEQDPFHKVER